MKVVALQIQVDFLTGERAGGIDPRDPGLVCPGWQDVDNGVEIRLVKDGRDIEQYRNIPGVTVLEGVDAINARVAELFPPKYAIKNEILFTESIKAKRIALDDIDPNLPPDQQIAKLHKRGALGIVKREVPKLGPDGKIKHPPR